MYFKIISHACLQLKHNGIELVIDPWFLGSCYWRSWWNYPPVQKNDYKNLKPDFIYLSHIHWDHFHSHSLKYLGKDRTIIIPYGRHTRTKDDLHSLGFTNIIELRNRSSIKLNSDLKITSYQFAPTCTDSALVIEGGGYTILNLNDCKIFGYPLNDIIRRHKKFDFVLKSHSSANARVCYKSLNEEDLRLDNKDRYAKQFYYFMKKIKPVYAIPFASNSCYLHRDTIKYNDFSLNPLELKEKFNKLNFSDNKNSTKLKIMIQGSSWSEISGFDQIPYKEWFDNKSKSKKIDLYQEEVQIKLNSQYEKDNRSKVPFRIVHNFFSEFFSDLNYFFKMPLKGHKICIKYYNKTECNYVLIDVFNSFCQQVKSSTYEDCSLRIDIPNIVLKQCLKLNMFSHGAISKRITFYCLPYNQNKLRYFEYLLEMKETRVIPLYKNINLRSLSNIITRWRELVLYFHSILLLYLKSNNRDDIQKYFLKKSQHKYLSISYNYRKFPNSV